MNEYKSELSNLTQRLKQANEQKQLHEIKPVVEKSVKTKNEVQLMIWIDADLMKKLRICTIEKGMTIKDMVGKAISNYLESG
jgi:NRPS condensation-like uncharacterized protein